MLKTNFQNQTLRGQINKGKNESKGFIENKTNQANDIETDAFLGIITFFWYDFCLFYFLYFNEKK